MRMRNFSEWLDGRLRLESAQDEAEEFIGQGYDAKVPEVLQVLQNNGVAFDQWGGPQANDSTQKMTKAVESAKEGSVSPTEIPSLANFANKAGDTAALKAILDFRRQNPTANPKDPESYRTIRQAYVDAMSARDQAEGRQRGYGDVGKNLDNIIQGNYEPPVIYVAGGKKIVIGGRTRLYAGLALGVPVKVKMMTERDVAQTFGAPGKQAAPKAMGGVPPAPGGPGPGGAQA